MQKYLVGAKPARKATNIEVHINRKLATDQTIVCVCVFAILGEWRKMHCQKRPLHGSMVYERNVEF